MSFAKPTPDPREREERERERERESERREPIWGAPRRFGRATVTHERDSPAQNERLGDV